jgi:DNA-directed RNA polymerase beta' subunit
MKLKLLDIDEFVEKNKLKPVTTVRMYEKVEKTDPNGLFSEEIFGRFGSAERRRTFAYIDLRTKIIHPEVYPIILSLDPNIPKLINHKEKYIIEGGLLVVDEKNGDSGVSYFIEIFDKINLDRFKKFKNKNIKFIKDNRDKIFIDKYLVLPAGIRDLSISRSSNQTIVNFVDLSEKYGSLVRQTNMLGTNIQTLPNEIKNPVIDQIQRTVCDINNWIKDRMKGKSGLIRGGLLRKSTDYSARLVVTGDHTLKLGTVGLPWQVVLKLYEPFALNYILKKDSSALGVIQQLLKSETPPDINDLKRLFTNIINEPEIVTPQLREYFVHVAEEIIRDKVIIYKRDPVNSRDSWLAANVRVDNDGISMRLNPLDLPRTTGDFDGDQFAVLALFTKEAQEEAKTKMHPAHAESIWSYITNIGECPYQIKLDAATTIYAATKQ